MMETHGYRYRLINPETKNSSVERIRYLDCRLTSKDSVYDGEEIINNSNKESLSLSISCPYFLTDCLGYKARLDFEDVLDKDFIVTELSCSLTSKGESTTVLLERVLRKEDYYVAD